MSTTKIDKMVERFLGWPLPPDFCPDGGVTFNRTLNEQDRTYKGPFWPVGTNLLTASQAHQMLEYIAAEDSSDMPLHQQRVVSEKGDLDEKIAKLDRFVNDERFGDICDFNECCRLINQLHIMRQYSEVLGDRITGFSAPAM